MAYTSDNQSKKRYEAAILMMPLPQTSACPPTKPDTTDFNQWWHDMTKKIKNGDIAFSVQEQYKRDLLCAVYDEIEQLANLEDDWDAEGALAIDRRCILEAQSFINQLRSEVVNETTELTMPSVNAAVDGGVQLYWFTRWGQTALTFHPGQQMAEVQTKQRNGPGEHRSVPIANALKAALQAMRDVSNG